LIANRFLVSKLVLDLWPASQLRFDFVRPNRLHPRDLDEQNCEARALWREKITTLRTAEFRDQERNEEK